jgi:hypothetical protein
MGHSGFISYPGGRNLKSIALAGFEPATFGSSGKNINHYTTNSTATMIG